MSRLGAQIATAVEPGRNGFEEIGSIPRSASEIDLVIQVAEACHTNRGLVPHGRKKVASEPERSVCGFALQSDDEIAMKVMINEASTFRVEEGRRIGMESPLLAPRKMLA